MALAFHILCHRDPHQVRRLLAAAWDAGNVYVIHYDARKPGAEHRQIAELARGRPNVIIQHPRAVLWGRYSLYAAQVEGLRLAAEHNKTWRHWVNLSGQCYPLLAPAAINEASEAAPNRSYVRHFAPLAGGDWPNPEWRINRRYIDSPALERLLRLPGIGRRLRAIFGGQSSLPSIPGLKRALPHSFTWFGGDNWVVLARRAAEHILTSLQAREISARLRHSAFPEESLFQTILMNSPFASTVTNHHRRAVKWTANAASPNLFGLDDLAVLRQAAAEGNWFARKFAADSPVLNEIDRQFLRRSTP